MQTIIAYCKPYFLRMSGGLAVKFVGTIMDLFLPWILAYMIDHVVPQRNMGLIGFWGVVMVICSILAVTMNIVANRMASAVGRDVTRTMRHDLFEKISYLAAPRSTRLQSRHSWRGCRPTPTMSTAW